MNVVLIAICAVLLLMLLIVAILWFSKNRKMQALTKEHSALRAEHDDAVSKCREVESENLRLTNKYEKIIDIDAEVDKSKNEKSQVEKDIESLRSDYKEKKKVYDNLVTEAALYDETIELAELGYYEPHFDFDASETYKQQIKENKSKQKQMLSAKNAIYCDTEWEVRGSKSEGRKMTGRHIRLTSRAFNNECDAAISSATWSNAARLEKRIEKAYFAINKLNESMQVHISHDYLVLKLEELHLTYEYKQKRKEERDEQAEIKRQMREEAKLQQEAERVRKEEEKYAKLLEKAKADAEKASGATLTTLQQKIAELDKQLEDAHSKTERAMSMAQQTKLGHVYVISNIGSFGEDVYKIGMTRRLDPNDRVKELGDASVPFLFDVHAMIFSEDAPALENQLHRAFDKRRLNLVNTRKEFFRVGLQDIAEEVAKIEPDAEFIETAEAQHYRETLAIRAKLKQSRDKILVTTLPDEI